MARGNAGLFGMALRDWHRTQVADANRFKRMLALVALAKVVEKSPVDTGRFRGNWQVTTGHPATGEVGSADDAWDQSPPGSAAGTAMAAHQGQIGGLQPGDSIYLTNNVPYAGALEYGHSQQAAQGMVAVTVAELELIRSTSGTGAA